jgi:hypothetical protein
MPKSKSEPLSAIERLRREYPPLMSVAQYALATNRSVPSVYAEFKKNPRLAVKQGGSRRILRDVWLASTTVSAVR